MREIKSNKAKYVVYGTVSSLLKVEELLKKNGYEGVMQNETARKVNQDDTSPFTFNWIIAYGGSKTFAYMSSNPTEGKFKAPDEIDRKELKKQLKLESKSK